MADAEPTAPAPETGQASDADKLGTVLMVGGLILLGVILADLAFKGKLLAPLFALLPAPRSPAAPEGPDDGALPDTG